MNSLILGINYTKFAFWKIVEIRNDKKFGIIENIVLKEKEEELWKNKIIKPRKWEKNKRVLRMQKLRKSNYG